MREGAQKAGIKLLEPVMKVEVVTPEDYLSDVIGDLNSRRGQIQGTDSRGNAQVVEAMVPLANMFGYVNQLRSFTQGRAQYTMQFSHYEEVPQNVADEVKAKLARSEEHTSELQSLMRISYAVFCLKTKQINQPTT